MDVLFSNGMLKNDLISKIDLSDKRFYKEDILQLISIGFNSSKMYRSSRRIQEYPNIDIVDYFVNVEQVGDGYAAFVNNYSYGVYRAGIGIASDGSKTKIILSDSFSYFINKYKEKEQYVVSAALLLFISALKNSRYKDVFLFGKFLFSRCLFKSIYLFVNSFKFIKLLKLPSK